MDHTPLGSTVKAPPTNFTGDVYVTPAKAADEDVHLIVATVRFTPGARTNWHSHINGQALLITEGEGVLVNRAGKVAHVRQGDMVWTPPGEEHWHGAGTDTLMGHVAILNGIEGTDGTTWLEPVDNDTFTAAQA